MSLTLPNYNAKGLFINVLKAVVSPVITCLVISLLCLYSDLS